WGSKISQNLNSTNTQILVAGDGLITNNDPHVWLSPALIKQEAKKIATALESLDKENAKYYAQNEKDLEQKLDQINQIFKLGLINCKTRSFVTSHEAFGYLAKDYGLNQIAIDGLSPDEEPSLSRLANLTSVIKESGVKYIFFETLASPKL